MKRVHPEYYALVNGQREDGGTANECLSSLGLFTQNTAFLRVIYDHYDVPIISVMPADGFTSMCQCRWCDGQATLDRGRAGFYSDYVWKYIDRVAKAIETTHPDKLILGGAYSTYQLPPNEIDKLNSNVVVDIVNGRPRYTTDDAQQAADRKLREQWLSKTDHKLSLFTNQFTRGYRPGYLPHVMARGMQESQGQLWRTFLWVSQDRGGLENPGVNHLIPYVLTRFWWDQNRDIDALMNEYYDKFYGPAANEMQALIEHCQAHYLELTESKEALNTMFELFDAAKAKVSPESDYGKRIALVDEYLNHLRSRRDQLNKGRGDMPEFGAENLPNDGLWGEAKANFKLDGKLNEAFWDHMHGRLREVQTGRAPTYRTQFNVLSGRDAIYFGIRCERPGDGEVTIGADQDGDPAIWRGDNVEILLETDKHSYYQIAISPSGAVTDLDRASGQTYRWKSKAEVGTHITDDYWSVEVRIPFVEETDDPLHLVNGSRPSRNLPWYFNVCRQHVYEGGRVLSAYSPTGTASFHDPMKFAELYTR